MKIKAMFVAMALSVLPMAANAEDPTAEEQLRAATEALEAAVRRLAEVRVQQYEHKPKKAMLGILLGDESHDGGVRIIGTARHGGAAEAGLTDGDLIVTIDGNDLAKADDPLGALVKHMKDVSPGDTVSVVYLRDGESVAADIVTQGPHMGGHKKAMLGILLGDNPNQSGVRIVGTTPKGGAAEAGMEAGDLIVTIDGNDLSKEDDSLGVLVKHMKGVSPGDTVSVVYLRDGESFAADIVTKASGSHVFSMLDGLEGLKALEDLEIDIPGIVTGLKTVQNIEVVTHSGHLLKVKGDLADYFDVEEGVILLEAQDGSELKGGDVLLSIGGEEVTDPRQATKLLTAIDDTAEVEVRRKGRKRTVNAGPDELGGPVDKEVQVIRIEKD